ncbi:MAG: tetrahydromethanopterin S-methyltransferase subunit H [Thermoprotei archaeon]|nr:MAG: tetrahydromethanopterin S-methyltransferase subunit H [Thermoprotei archaeon]RLE90109.1 MAG: tetrahydromethanopterin S-methyltransferase subunit H [Thermoprotei archaeon]
MFKFKTEQRIFDIAGVKVGGQPGQLPTVLIGSIFYHGHKIVIDQKSGNFDRHRAEELLNREKEYSEATGNPRIIDICCSYPDAFSKFIDFVANNTDDPIAIDGTTADVRIAGAKYVYEVGLSERTVYNSINPHTKEHELEVIRECRIRSAILLTLNIKRPTVLGRLEVLNELLDKARVANIENILVDTTVLDIPDAGPVSKAIYLVKEKYGLPAGAGVHNAVDRWKSRAGLSRREYELASTVANTLAIAMGADFILYGPIENAPIAYFLCALADAYTGFSIRQEYGIRPIVSTHPMFRIFRRDRVLRLQ